MPLPAKYDPTPEQELIIDAAIAGEDITAQAGAGTGKTSTLRLIGKAKPRQRGLAITYNKGIATDMARTFPNNMKASTAHSLAWQSIIKPNALLQERLEKKERLPIREVIRRLKIDSTLDVGHGRHISPYQQARLAQEAVVNFCKSAQKHVELVNVPDLEFFDDEIDDDWKGEVLTLAKRVWKDVSADRGVLPFNHSHYLKLYELDEPYLNFDFVCVDEAQDCNPVIASIVDQQGHAQLITVGDSNQAINAWNGAIDAMDKFGGRPLQLTQSFRFGPPIAQEANKWLALLESDLRVRGFEAVQSEVAPYTPEEEPFKAILTRTNGGAMAQALTQLQLGRKVAIAGGSKELYNLAKAAVDLKEGKRTEHPELWLFESWAELREYATEDVGGQDLKVLVDIIDNYGTMKVLWACGQFVDETTSGAVIVSTAHKSKGREWTTVRIGSDFMPTANAKGEVRPITREDLMLAYVAVTRAKNVLDLGGLSWINGEAKMPELVGVN